MTDTDGTAVPYLRPLQMVRWCWDCAVSWYSDDPRCWCCGKPSERTTTPTPLRNRSAQA